jgi:hypothetical protein
VVHAALGDAREAMGLARIVATPARPFACRAVAQRLSRRQQWAEAVATVQDVCPDAGSRLQASIEVLREDAALRGAVSVEIVERALRMGRELSLQRMSWRGIDW